MGGYSKALIAIARDSYNGVAEKLIKKFNRIFIYTQSVSEIDQEVIRRFLNEGILGKTYS